MKQAVDRAGELIAARARVRQLIAAEERVRHLITANSEITAFPLVLRRIVEAACELVEARFGALGMIGADGRLGEFRYFGMDEDTVEAIQDVPMGRGVLGAVIETPLALRAEINGHAVQARTPAVERSSDPPANNPPTRSFLSVPIRSGTEVFANLYLFERHSGPFTEEDEDLVSAFAISAGIAVENARLYDESRRRERWLQASAEISDLLLSPQAGRDPLEEIVQTVRNLADADLVSLVIPAVEARALEVAVAAGEGVERLRGMHYSVNDSLVSLAVETGRGVRVGAVDEHHQYPVHLTKVAAVGPAMAVPLAGRDGPQGAIVVGRLKGRRAFTSGDLEMAETFSKHAAIARELADGRNRKQRLELLEDRDRIARDLHDHVVQRLFAAGLSVQSMAGMADDVELVCRLNRLVEDIDGTIRQIRTSIFELQADDPPAGVRSTVLKIVSELTPVLGFAPDAGFSGPLDTVIPATARDSIGAVLREALTNVAKHSQATDCAIELSVDHHQLVLVVADNGVGLDKGLRRSGIENLRRRAEIWGGTLVLKPNQPQGTRLQWTIPLPT